MAATSPQSRTNLARQLLNGSTSAAKGESDVDPFHVETDEEEDWEWIRADDPSELASANPTSGHGRKRKVSTMLQEALGSKIIGARRGKFECRLGDAVRLKADGMQIWVALICEFNDVEDEDSMEATFMWLSPESEIRNKAKKRTDCLPYERYVTPAFDDNSLDCIEGKATVVSVEEFNRRYPNGKIPKQSRDFERLFICRRGCNIRTATYTEEFVWEEMYQGANDVEKLKDRIEKETKATRRRTAGGKDKTKDLDKFVVGDDENDESAPKTPSKRRKLNDLGTPSKRVGKTPTKFTTPTHKRIISKKPLEFTPLGTRFLSPTHTIASPFQVARSQLHVSSVPTALPCREDEFSTVYSYLEAAITDGTGSCIYISGTPGTGKTATVREVVAQLNASVQAEELDDFIFVEINGMKVTDPHQSYALLWEALTGDRVSPTHALSLLEREFSRPSPRRVPCVVLMDELDQLVTKNQSVMYNFFNWPNLRHSRLIVLAVANTMDLPERTLSNKISSRLGLTRITFPGYTHEQLIKIIQSRLEGVPGNIVQPDAVQFASRKVAQVSGDARRALDICRRAVEIAELEAQADPVVPDTPSKKQKTQESDAISKPKKIGQVTIATIQRAIREATTSPLQQYLRSLPLASKIFLGAILARVRRTGVAECVLGDVVEEAKRLSNMSQLPAVRDFLLSNSKAPEEVHATPRKSRTTKTARPTRLLAMGAAAMDLAESGVILVESRRGERAGKVRLTIGDEEIKLALKDDPDSRELGFAAG